MQDDVLRGCLLADERAWTSLVDRYSGLVLRVARSARLTRDECDDVMQSVFTTLVRRVHTIRDSAALPGWLSRTAQRESWRVIREKRRLKLDASHEVDDHSCCNHVHTHLDQSGAAELRRALTSVGEPCSELIMALFLDPSHPSYQLISKRLSLPIGSIGPMRCRCLEKLAAAMSKHN